MQMRKNDMDQIWFITAIISNKTLEKMPFYTDHNTRTFGYYRGFQTAWQAVKENRCNMQECLYGYLVMERIDEGIHALAIDEQWFKWNGTRWASCAKPAEYKGLTNWALG